MTTRARETRRARAQRREDLRTVLWFLAAVIVGSTLGISIDGWFHP
jgi:fatty acid desaturase